MGIIDSEAHSVGVSATRGARTYEGPIYQGPMIDAHSHAGPMGHTPDLFRAVIEEARLEKVVLCPGGGPPDLPRDLPKELSQLAPGRVVPFVSFQRDKVTGKLIINREGVNYIQQAIESGWAKGVGEVSLRHEPFIFNPAGDHNPADQPLLLEIYDLAAKYRVPVEIHFEFEEEYGEELERALAHNQETKIVWLHFGDASPRILRERLARHPNLYVDLSDNSPISGFKNPELAPADSEGNIKADWTALFLEFPDRFLFGIDMGNEERWRNGAQVARYYRRVLGQLPAVVAENVAHKNILVLLKKDYQI